MGKYKRKTDGPSRICQSKLEKARKAIMEKKRPINKVASTYGISKSSLKNYKNKWKLTDTGVAVKSLHGSRVLTDEEESAFVQVLQDFKLSKIPVTVSDTLRLCYSFADKVGSDKITKWRDTKKASMDWMSGFLRRNQKARELIRKNSKGYGGSSALPSSSRPRNSKEINTDLDTSAARTNSNNSNSEGDSKKSDSDDDSKGSVSDSRSHGSGSESSSNGSVSSDMSKVSKTQETREGFLISAKADKSVVFSTSIPATTLRKSTRISKVSLTDVVENPEPDNPRNLTHDILQIFEEELEKFVEELKLQDIHPSDADITLIRAKCIESLNSANVLEDGQVAATNTIKKPLKTKKQDIFQSHENLFGNLYEQNLRNNVNEGIKLEKDGNLNVIMATRNFDKFEFVIEIKGSLLDSSKGKKMSTQADFVYGKNRGKIFCLGKMEEMKWMNCSRDLYAQAVQDSDDPNLKLNFKKVSVGSTMTGRLFFVAKRPILRGEILTYDYGRVQARNSLDFPFLASS